MVGRFWRLLDVRYTLYSGIVKCTLNFVDALVFIVHKAVKN
jgi:hypothetical protein